MAKINRRSFLGATIGSLLGASGLFAGEAFAKPIPVPKHWDRTVDVLVVGSGFSGLSASIEARTNGADVLCIEKMAMIGGNSVLSAGGLAAPGNDLQVAAGIKDSPELLLKDMLKSGGNLNNVECAKVVAYGALDAYRWAKDFLGVKSDRLGYQGGHSVARSACYMNGTGANMIGPMSKKCKEIGVPVETRSRLLNLVLDEKGAVIGAEVQQGYVFPKEDSGKKVFIRRRLRRRLLSERKAAHAARSAPRTAARLYQSAWCDGRRHASGSARRCCGCSDGLDPARPLDFAR